MKFISLIKKYIESEIKSTLITVLEVVLTVLTPFHLLIITFSTSIWWPTWISAEEFFLQKCQVLFFSLPYPLVYRLLLTSLLPVKFESEVHVIESLGVSFIFPVTF